MAMSASAQTGGDAPSRDRLTPEKLVDILIKHGHQANLKTFKDGVKNVDAAVTIDGLRYELEFAFDPKTLTFHVYCVLGYASQLAPHQFEALLRKNWDLPMPMHFTIRPDGKLMLEDPNFSTMTTNETGVLNIINLLTKSARNTQSVWAPAGAVSK